MLFRNSRRSNQNVEDETHFEKAEKAFNRAQFFLSAPIKFFVKPVFKSIKVSQAKPLPPKIKEQIKKEGISILVVASDKKFFEQFRTGGTRKNPIYTVEPIKRGFMSYVRGAMNGFMPSYTLFIGKTISIDVLKLNKDILNHKRIPSEFYTLHIAGEDITEEMFDKLRYKATDGILYSRHSMNFNKIIKVEKSEMFRKRKSLNLLKGYTGWVIKLTIAISIPLISSIVVQEVKQQVMPHVEGYIEPLYEQVMPDIELPSDISDLL